MLEDINKACTLFVGDLSSCCNEENLQIAFGQYGKVKHVRIQQIKDKHSGHKVSAGYGFVRMFTPEQAEIAMTSMDGSLIAGRQVRVRYATYHTEDASKVESRMSLYVKYVAKTQTAFTNEEIIRELFSKFGTVVDVTIRKQFLNSRKSIMRGYAFVHYADDIDGLQSALNLLTYYPSILYNHHTSDMQFNEYVINETAPNMESILMNGIDLTKDYVLYTMSPSKSLEAALAVVQQCQSIESLTAPPAGPIGQYTKPDAEPRMPMPMPMNQGSMNPGSLSGSLSGSMNSGAGVINHQSGSPADAGYMDHAADGVDMSMGVGDASSHSLLYHKNDLVADNLLPSRVSMHHITMQQAPNADNILAPEYEPPQASLLSQRAMKYAQKGQVQGGGYIPASTGAPSHTMHQSQYIPRVVPTQQNQVQGGYNTTRAPVPRHLAYAHNPQYSNQGTQQYRPRVVEQGQYPNVQYVDQAPYARSGPSGVSPSSIAYSVPHNVNTNAYANQHQHQNSTINNRYVNGNSHGRNSPGNSGSGTVNVTQPLQSQDAPRNVFIQPRGVPQVHNNSNSNSSPIPDANSNTGFPSYSVESLQTTTPPPAPVVDYSKWY